MNILLRGFIVAQNDIEPFMIWGYYISPVMYGQNALVINEFLDKRWSAPNPDPRIHAPTVGKVLLKSRGFFTDDYMFWVCVGALLGFSLLFNILFIKSMLQYCSIDLINKMLKRRENPKGAPTQTQNM
ncbi:ABC transporter G family member 39-like [Camellia sinensis]|uniref:ABC transporter G family member 39-like n=1 Tax=Camellia sinensis TaxID=4442 RepID=UPI0010355D1A|nr:ABC transporter G family member 39-like [Camellia sinensis]